MKTFLLRSFLSGVKGFLVSLWEVLYSCSVRTVLSNRNSLQSQVSTHLLWLCSVLCVPLLQAQISDKDLAQNCVPVKTWFSFTHSLPVLNSEQMQRWKQVCGKKRQPPPHCCTGWGCFVKYFYWLMKQKLYHLSVRFEKFSFTFLWILCFHCVTSYLFLYAQPKQTRQNRVFLPTSEKNLCKTNISGKFSSDIFNQFEWFKLSVFVWTQETQMVCVCFCLQVGDCGWNEKVKFVLRKILQTTSSVKELRLQGGSLGDSRPD